MRVVAIRLARTGAVVASAELADRSPERRRGLLGRDSLPPGRGLLLRPCGSVHTFGMRFPIDVVFLDRGGRVLRVVERMGARRLAWGGWRAWQTLEPPAGTARQAGVSQGDRLLADPGNP
jgi:hypothetical protein